MSFGTSTPRFYEAGGGKVPSVTTILSVLDKPALIFWAINCSHDFVLDKVKDYQAVKIETLQKLLKASRFAHRNLSEKAMAIGTETHNAIEAHLKGKKVADLSEPAQRAFAAYLWWEAEVGLEVLSVEEEVAGDGYAGRTDLVARVNGVTTLVDFKTSKGAKMYDTYPMQLAAYRKALEKKGYGIEAMAILGLDKETGENQYHSIPEDDYENLYEAFACLARFWSLTRGVN